MQRKSGHPVEEGNRQMKMRYGLPIRVMRIGGIAVAFIALISAATARPQAPIEYRLSFPDAVHHVMQVEVTFGGVPPGPLRVRMSRSSPGRYAAFEFAKNVFEEHITDGNGKVLAAA